MYGGSLSMYGGFPSMYGGMYGGCSRKRRNNRGDLQLFGVMYGMYGGFSTFVMRYGISVLKGVFRYVY
jgi:hypothetical protein